MTTPYRVQDGALVAEAPERGPCWAADRECHVGLDHRRRRKTGPPWRWVAVMRCTVHRCAFTAYPPGHVPYGQVPVVALAPDGGPLVRAGGSADTEAAPETVFTAATDAAREEPALWPRTEAKGATRSTQARRLERSAALLGLRADLGPDATTTAGVTHLPCGALVEAIRELTTARGLLGRAPRIAAVLGQLGARSQAVMDRLAVVGHLAGLWGRPYRWDGPTRRQLLALGEPFLPRRTTGTRGPASPSSAGGGTHDSGVRRPP